MEDWDLLIPLLADECGLEQTAAIAGYLAAASARQCGPCLFGLKGVADLMLDLAGGTSRRRDIPRLQRFLAEIGAAAAAIIPTVRYAWSPAR